MKGRQIKIPTKVPAVPGAKGASPEPNPVARNVISFSFKIAPEECFCGFMSLRDTIPRRYAPGIISNPDISGLDSSACVSSFIPTCRDSLLTSVTTSSKFQCATLLKLGTH